MYETSSDDHTYLLILQVGVNGLISLSTKYEGWTPYLFPIPGVSVVAPYWIDQQFISSNDSLIFYHKYNAFTDTDMQSRNIIERVNTDLYKYANVNNFNATWAIVVTWSQISPYPSYFYQEQVSK